MSQKLLLLLLTLLFGIFQLAQATTLEIPNWLGDITDVNSLINRIINLLVKLAIVIAPILIIYAGFLYITAAGNEQTIQKAHRVLIWALIGLAVVILATGIPALIKEFLGVSETDETCNGTCCSQCDSDDIPLGPCKNGLMCCPGLCAP